MEDLKKELAQITEKIDATVLKMDTENKGELKQLRTEFVELTKKYNDLSAQLEEKLQTVQKSVDKLSIEEQRLHQQTVNDLRTALSEQLNSEAFKGYLKAKKGGSKKASYDVTMENIEARKATVTPSTATTDTSAPDYLNTGIIYDPSRDMFVRNFIPSGTTNANTVVVPVEVTISDGTAVTTEGSHEGV